MLKAWTKFERRRLDNLPPSEAEIKATARRFRKSEDDVREVYADLVNDVVWVNSRYQVNIREVNTRAGSKWPPMLHLSIKRIDKERIGEEHYRDLLRIKNELVGEEHEGVELFPAMSRNVDTANQYHLWVVALSGIAFPFGYMEHHMSADTTDTGAKQAPFDDGDLPT